MVNLRKVRILFATVAALFLILCHVTYLFAYSQNRQQQFAGQMDQPPLQIFSFLLLVGIIILAVLKTDEEDVST